MKAKTGHINPANDEFLQVSNRDIYDKITSIEKEVEEIKSIVKTGKVVGRIILSWLFLLTGWFATIAYL